MRLIVNGEPREVEARNDETVLAVLRREGLLSVRETCGVGVCGACTVLVDGMAMSACLLLAKAVEGLELQTAEGFGSDDPVVRAFVQHHAFQCAFCTPAMVLAAKRLLAEIPHPTEREIRLAMSGNLCRCGSYAKIIEAIRAAAA